MRVRAGVVLGNGLLMGGTGVRVRVELWNRWVGIKRAGAGLGAVREGMELGWGEAG